MCFEPLRRPASNWPNRWCRARRKRILNQNMRALTFPFREGRMASDGAWLTYREAATLLGINIEAVRQRAIRCRWPRTVGNDKRALIQIPEGLTIPVREGNEGAPRRVATGALERRSRGPMKGRLSRAYRSTLRCSLNSWPRPMPGLLRLTRAKLSTSPIWRPNERRPRRRSKLLRRSPSASTRWRPSAPGRGGGGWRVEPRGLTEGLYP